MALSNQVVQLLTGHFKVIRLTINDVLERASLHEFTQCLYKYQIFSISFAVFVLFQSLSLHQHLHLSTEVI